MCPELLMPLVERSVKLVQPLFRCVCGIYVANCQMRRRSGTKLLPNTYKQCAQCGTKIITWAPNSFARCAVLVLCRNNPPTRLFSRFLEVHMSTSPDQDSTSASAVVAELPLPTQLEHLSKLIAEKPETLATGDEELRKAALDATKFVYDLGAPYVSVSSSRALTRPRCA